MPSEQARAIRTAAEGASLHSFHLGMMIAAALVALCGIVGGIWIRNPVKPDEQIHAQSCAGGQLVGASSEIGGPAAEPVGA